MERYDYEKVMIEDINVDDTIKLNAEQAKIINELKNIMNKLDKPTIAKKQEPTLD